MSATILYSEMSYRDLPFEELPIKGNKRVYLSGQFSIHKPRKELLIDNDYVLTDDCGRYIDTDEILTREYLINLTQEQIQGSKKPTYIFLPIPRAEAKYKKLKAIKDKNNIGQYKHNIKEI